MLAYQQRGVSHMSESDRTYLKTILEGDAKQYSGLPPDEHFEIFAAEQVLKRFALDSEEIESGITRGAHDGGADSIYILMDRKLIREDPELKEFQRKGIPVELIVI